MDRDPFDLVGDVLDGQFRVDAFAGEGDLSVVYRGHHLGVDAPVAIKCLNLPETLDPALARPLVDGFKEASRVHYRLARGNLHIAQTIASGSTLVPRSGVVVPYLVREWFDGESLASNLAGRRARKCTGRSVDETLALMESAFDGVAYAHAQGEVHLSLNPSNLFVVNAPGTPSTPVLKVLDFGVARTMNAFTSGRPGAGLRLLFPAYAAPEQLDWNVGTLGPATDVYALALVMLEILSDRVVMGETETGAVVEHALDEQRRPTPQAHGLKLPSHIERALARAVSRSPARRQKNAADLWKDVKNTVRSVSRSMAAVVPPAASAVPKPAAAPAPAPAPASAPAPTLGAPSVKASPFLPSLTPAPPAVPGPRVPTPMPMRAPIGVAARPAGAMPAPRMRAATLVGLSPPALPAPSESVSRPAPSPAVSTRPLAFEPASRADVAPAVPPVIALHAPPVPEAPARPVPTAAPPAPLDSAPTVRPDAPSAADFSLFEDSPPPTPLPELIGATPVPGAPLTPPPSASDAPPTTQPVPEAAPLPPPLPPMVPNGAWGRVDPLAQTVSFTPGAGAVIPSLAAPLPAAGVPLPVIPDAPAASRAPAPAPPRGPALPPALARYGAALRALITPKTTPIVLVVAGGLFWLWAVAVFGWICTMPLRHARAQANAEASSASAASVDVAPPSTAQQAAAALPPLTASPPVTAPPTAAAGAPGAPEAAAQAAGAPFRNAAAIRALDGKWRDVAKCRRGKAWGKASTTVTFSNDGSVSHVEVGEPFGGTPTGDCIADALAGTHVEPFGDKSAVLVYKVYVAPK